VKQHRIAAPHKLTFSREDREEAKGRREESLEVIARVTLIEESLEVIARVTLIAHLNRVSP
jgi:hypothetical protein